MSVVPPSVSAGFGVRVCANLCACVCSLCTAAKAAAAAVHARTHAAFQKYTRGFHAHAFNMYNIINTAQHMRLGRPLPPNVMLRQSDRPAVRLKALQRLACASVCESRAEHPCPVRRKNSKRFAAHTHSTARICIKIHN